MKYASHDEYMAKVPMAVRERLIAIQTKVESVVPDAVRCIAYSIPAYQAGKVFFYFAAFKEHIGIYPPLKRDKVLIRKLQRYRGPKGNLILPLSEALPIELIGRLAVALHREYAKR